MLGHIYFIMGVSGAGKSTLIKNIKSLNLENIHFPLSYKTRAIRENEINGVDAYFISPQEFYSQILNKEFLEYAKVHETDYYGTKFEDVIENGVNKGKIVIKELDINGLMELKTLKPELKKHYTTIFLNIPNSFLVDRVNKRGNFISPDELKRRISSSIIEEEKAKELCDYIIDSTLEKKEVLKEFLKILNLKTNFINNFLEKTNLNHIDSNDIELNITEYAGEFALELVNSAGEVILEFFGDILSNIDL